MSASTSEFDSRFQFNEDLPAVPAFKNLPKKYKTDLHGKIAIPTGSGDGNGFAAPTPPMIPSQKPAPPMIPTSKPAPPMIPTSKPAPVPPAAKPQRADYSGLMDDLLEKLDKKMLEFSMGMKFEEAIKARDLKEEIEAKKNSGDTSSVELKELLDRCEALVS